MFKFIWAIIIGIIAFFAKLVKVLITNFVFVAIIGIILSVLGYGACLLFGTPFFFLRSNKPLVFRLMTLSQQPALSSGIPNGNPYILYFTSIKCKNCLQQLQAIKDLGERTGYKIYAIFPLNEGNSAINLAVTYREAVDDVYFDDSSVARLLHAYIFPQTTLMTEENVELLSISGKLLNIDIARIQAAINTNEKASQN